MKLSLRSPPSPRPTFRRTFEITPLTLDEKSALRSMLAALRSVDARYLGAGSAAIRLIRQHRNRTT